MAIPSSNPASKALTFIKLEFKYPPVIIVLPNWDASTASSYASPPREDDETFSLIVFCKVLFKESNVTAPDMSIFSALILIPSSPKFIAAITPSLGVYASKLLLLAFITIPSSLTFIELMMSSFLTNNEISSFIH